MLSKTFYSFFIHHRPRPDGRKKKTEQHKLKKEKQTKLLVK